MEKILQSLEEYFGFSELREGQAEVIGNILSGQSSLAIFPTGGGKSLCYQLPAVCSDGTAVVISPLLALMKDQVDQLILKGIAAARLDSTLSDDQYDQALKAVVNGDLKLLYMSPEKLGDPNIIKLLRKVNISFVAIDEAHCISEWGHNFRPDYLKLTDRIRRLGIRVVLGLTATATPKVAKEIAKQFRIKQKSVVSRSFHRQNLHLQVTPTNSVDRKQLLLKRCREREGAAIVYVTRQETAEAVATFLAKNGVSAKAYHAGLRAELRREIQDGFMSGEYRMVVATIAFGMGVDKSNIRTVYHYNLPKSIEGYSQEIGRAGRDGQPAICETLACGDDLNVLENFIHSDAPSQQSIQNLIHRILGLGEEFDVSFYDLAVTADIRQTVIEIIFAYLETEGYLKFQGVFWASFRVKLLRPREKVFAGHSKVEQKLLERLFAPLDADWKWLQIDVNETADRLGKTPKKIRSMIFDLEAADDIALRKRGWRHRYKVKKMAAPPELAARYAARFAQRESQDLERLSSVVDLLSSKECIVKKLLKHFGEDMLVRCGNCSSCHAQIHRNIARTKARKVTQSELENIYKLLEDDHPALKTSRQLAKFLCGMSSPAAMRARLYKLDEYGMLADLPFSEVLTTSDSLL